MAFTYSVTRTPNAVPEYCTVESDVELTDEEAQELAEEEGEWEEDSNAAIWSDGYEYLVELIED